MNAAIAVYATRYALGRKTGAPDDVCAFIRTHIEDITRDKGCCQALIRDISAAAADGNLFDRDRWMRTLALLEDGAS